jgi:hypothetical protein
VSNKAKIVALACVAALVPAVIVGQSAVATHEPADKAVATASDLFFTSENNAPVTVLEERMKVSTTSDLILQLTSECSILTSLVTNNDTPEQGAFGQVKFFITLDGKRVPVSTDDTPAPPPEETDTTGTDLGEAVFCNRAYARRVTDQETEPDGIDEEADFIRTRTANAFNWLALNVGEDQAGGTTLSGYDSPTNGNNIIDVEVQAEFTKNPNACDDGAGPDGSLAIIEQTCAEAAIGSRTLIIEPTHASVHEQPEPGS